MANMRVKEAINVLGRKGRGGDTELAHINRKEAAILRALGGSGTVNPETGLREYATRGGLESSKESGSVGGGGDRGRGATRGGLESAKEAGSVSDTVGGGERGFGQPGDFGEVSDADLAEAYGEYGRGLVEAGLGQFGPTGFGTSDQGYLDESAFDWGDIAEALGLTVERSYDTTGPSAQISGVSDAGALSTAAGMLLGLSPFVTAGLGLAAEEVFGANEDDDEDKDEKGFFDRDYRARPGDVVEGRNIGDRSRENVLGRYSGGRYPSYYSSPTQTPPSYISDPRFVTAGGQIATAPATDEYEPWWRRGFYYNPYAYGGY